MHKRRQLYEYAIGIFLIFMVVLFFILRNPVLFYSKVQTKAAISPKRLEDHVRFLSELTPNRSYQNLDSLSRAEKYIQEKLNEFGFKTTLQDVNVNGLAYHNVIARYGDPNAKEIIVVGAHYDAAGTHNPGADDNASGIAGLLELAYQLKMNQPQLQVPIELVAYTLEEPPFFAKAEMGSLTHAKSLKQNGTHVRYMLSIEMIGYYSNEFFSQHYTLPVLYGIYPWWGNFIAVVGRTFSERNLIRELKRIMVVNSDVPVYSINAPAYIPGISYSDHRSYWAQGWPAVMITDTAFLRNFEYHQPGDTPDRLDYKKMAEAVRGIYATITNL